MSLFGVYKTTISGGGYTIDLTAFQGTNATLDGTGKKLIAIAIANPAASTGDVNVATGASNGYAWPSRSRSSRAVSQSSTRLPGLASSTARTKRWT